MCYARNATSDLGITNRVKIDFEGSTHQGFITTHVINPWCSTCLTENELEEGSKCWFMFKHRVRRNTSSRCFHFCFIRAPLKKGCAFHRIRVSISSCEASPRTNFDRGVPLKKSTQTDLSSSSCEAGRPTRLRSWKFGDLMIQKGVCRTQLRDDQYKSSSSMEFHSSRRF